MACDLDPQLLAPEPRTRRGGGRSGPERQRGAGGGWRGGNLGLGDRERGKELVGEKMRDWRELEMTFCFGLVSVLWWNGEKRLEGGGFRGCWVMAGNILFGGAVQSYTIYCMSQMERLM